MKMSDTKVYVIFVCALFVVSFIIGNAHTIFPVMDDDEYFVDENDVIHNGQCPYRSVPMFTKKRSKYDFVKNGDWTFCNECFSDEEIGTLMMLHDRNLKLYIERLEKLGASDGYIFNKLNKMNLE